jgi:hypothetical protein
MSKKVNKNFSKKMVGGGIWAAFDLSGIGQEQINNMLRKGSKWRPDVLLACLQAYFMTYIHPNNAYQFWILMFAIANASETNPEFKQKLAVDFSTAATLYSQTGNWVYNPNYCSGDACNLEKLEQILLAQGLITPFN